MTEEFPDDIMTKAIAQFCVRATRLTMATPVSLDQSANCLSFLLDLKSGRVSYQSSTNVSFGRISLKNSLDWLFIRPISFFRAAYQCFCAHAAAQGLKSCGSHVAITPYGGVCGLSFASLLRFCAVAASRNSSRASEIIYSRI